MVVILSVYVRVLSYSRLSFLATTFWPGFFSSGRGLSMDVLYSENEWLLSRCLRELGLCSLRYMLFTWFQSSLQVYLIRTGHVKLVSLMVIEILCSVCRVYPVLLVLVAVALWWRKLENVWWAGLLVKYAGRVNSERDVLSVHCPLHDWEYEDHFFAN